MRKLTFNGEIRNGVARIHRKQAFLDAIKTMPDGHIRFTLERIYHKHSDPQRGYYWGVVVAELVEAIKDEHEETVSKEWAHELLKSYCNSYEVANKENGLVLRMPLTTSTLTTVEYEEYLERCRRFILEYFNRTVLLPNEQSELMFNPAPQGE